MSFKTRIVQRLEWWRKEVEPDSRLGLWLRAAQDYGPESAQCPVCDQSIEGLPVEHEPATLKSMDPELQQELRTFFRNLLDELKAIIPHSLMALAAKSPPDRLLQDWKNLCEEAIGAAFQSVTANFSEPLRKLAAETPAVPDVPFDLFPEDAEGNFVSHAAEFIDDVKKAQAALAMLGWADMHLGALRESLVAAVIRPDGDDAASLLATLSRGRQAAADVEPLARVRDELRVIYKSREAIEVGESAVSLLEELATSLEQLKPLAKYAARLCLTNPTF